MAYIGRTKSIRREFRLLALAGLLLQLTGCVSSVVEAYRAGVMPNPMYFWLIDTEGPEIRIRWSRWDPNKVIENPWKKPFFALPPNILELHPDIPGCQAYEACVNDSETRIANESEAIAMFAVREPTSILPDDRFPECAILLTYHRPLSRPGLVVIAATRAGVLEEFPNGRRKPAWLLLTPLAAIGDSIPSLVLVAFIVVINPCFWLS